MGQQGAGFRIAGSLVRKYIAPSGKVAFLTVDVYDSDNGRSTKFDLKTFGRDVMDDLGELRAGAMIELTGSIDMEKVADKAREAVKVDGREKWVPSLIVRAIKTEASSRPPARQPEPREPGDDGEPARPPEAADVPY
jgi:hypothetical protein